MLEKRTPRLTFVASAGDHTVQEVLVEEVARSGNEPFHGVKNVCAFNEHAAM